VELKIRVSSAVGIRVSVVGGIGAQHTLCYVPFSSMSCVRSTASLHSRRK